MLNHMSLARPIEVDQHVAAKNGVHALEEEHARVVLQVYLREAYVRADRIVDDPQLAVIDAVLEAVERAHVPHRVLAIAGGLRMRERAIVEIGCDDLEAESPETTSRGFFHADHCERVRLF